MKYVDLDATIGAVSGVMSPLVYLERLPEFAGDLPEGARAFATDPGHYDFHGKWCVKDLKLARVLLEPGTEYRERGHLELMFRHNCFKHEEDLIIRYAGVLSLHWDGPANPFVIGDIGVVALDEVLPHDEGCSHEIACHNATISVITADLTATWIDAECDQKPSQPAV
ncbi:hypothetical protein EV193_103499 [Herbihabitans rhizosphaerae]|uniref:Immunity protein 50 of polymorphic toxin system n=1 Tax=Herbihabitans rhizosphaerae TaxID=1872711 RepID=A0A4Q7KVW5_9PSEU|nr:hypothetical protein [Herbihabitans rhizosphaerae]RZS41179.1 hypothetical protein EV193_103499 [Herbihabitans rhizosphaerae]